MTELRTPVSPSMRQQQEADIYIRNKQQELLVLASIERHLNALIWAASHPYPTKGEQK